MFKTGNFLFRREIIHYTGWQNLCREGIQTARSWQNLCREESRRRGAGRTSAETNPDGAGLAESLPGRIQTERGWQNLCREESGRRGAGRISAGKNPNSAELAESLPGRIPTARSWQNLCREESWLRGAGRISAGRNQRGFGQTRGLSLHEGANQCGWRTENHLSESVPTYGNESMWVSDGQQITPRGLSLHAGANQCGYRADSKSPLGVLSATSQFGKNNLTLYDMLIGIKLVENVKHICGKIDHCTVDKLIRYLVISLSNSPGYTGFSIGVAVAKHSYSDCVFKRV